MTERRAVKKAERDLESLAKDVLELARGRLLVNLRYMDTALMFQNMDNGGDSFSSDGRTLYYDPLFVLRTYAASKERLTETYIHSVLHCVFCHPFSCGGMDRRCWDIACDIATGAVVSELSLPCVRTDDDAEIRDVLRKIRRETGFLTAEKIYSALRKGELPQADSEEKLASLEKLFKRDDHSLWYAEENGPCKNAQITQAAPLPADDQKLAADWEKIAEQIEMEIETFARVRGRYASSLIQNLRAVNRDRYDYDAFLRKFAAINETVKLSEDEFDYVYYNYGLTHYRNMPFIEPLEYREDNRIKDFVIAVDTSGSVAGEEVQSFLEKTYNILKSRESFQEHINVHIVQCDAEVQSDTVITSQADLDRYISDMEIKGLGGTDFRPVFDHVDGLLREGEFDDLKGLIYFTDGLGTYPASKPSYRTAFVFIESGYNIPEVPVWAMKVVLSPEEL